MNKINNPTIILLKSIFFFIPWFLCKYGKRQIKKKKKIECELILNGYAISLIEIILRLFK